MTGELPSRQGSHLMVGFVRQLATATDGAWPSNEWLRLNRGTNSVKTGANG